jgi:hypothetical protein
MDPLARLHGHDFDRASVVVRPQNQMIARNLDTFHRAVCGARLFSWRKCSGDEHGMKKNETAIENPKFERGAKPGTTKSTQRKATDLGEIRRQITDLVGNGAVGMVETTMEEVGKGHYRGMKYLFQIDLGG